MTEELGSHMLVTDPEDFLESAAPPESLLRRRGTPAMARLQSHDLPFQSIVLHVAGDLPPSVGRCRDSA
jgi:hypothetical protein